MVKKYANGQRVAIISVLDQNRTPKYPEIQSYVSKIGSVVEGYYLYDKMPKTLRIHYTYTVRMDGSNKEITVPEDALVPHR